MRLTSRVSRALAVLLPLLVTIASHSPFARAVPTGEWVILSWNDLGMHCMNQNFANLCVLPPYNTLYAQIVRRGDATRPPQVAATQLNVEYSIPGNTWSIGKTDFWTWDQHLFGVDLPADIGLTGRGLTGELDPHAGYFVAEGIPVTPFTDAEPTVERPYQQALVIARNATGAELARAMPVIPVSVEMHCVDTGCHASELDVLSEHPGPTEGGFDPAQRPILCAACHGDPALGGTEPGPAGWFSLRMHEKHAFLDTTMPGLLGCYRCHPGPQTRCLRGTMSHDHDLICQNCHGDMQEVASSIASGRRPWLDEPACRSCHTAQFGEPVGQLYRHSTGHGGVYCAACHNSPHADFPSRDSVDNAVMDSLQGHAGVLSNCVVCHGVVPSGPGPHGIVPTAVVADELLAGALPLQVSPSPLPPGASCTLRAPASKPESVLVLVYDGRGRLVRKLDVVADGDGLAHAMWDGRDARGASVGAGVYFVRWIEGNRRLAAKIVETAE